MHFRKRFCEKISECVRKTCLHRKDFQMHAHGFKNGMQIRIAHNTEESVPFQKEPVTQMRHIQRYSFIHKDYIRFDASKIIQASAAMHEKQEPCLVQNEIEVELIKMNRQYMQQPNSCSLHAKSMIMKVLDVACMINDIKLSSLGDLTCKMV